MRLDYHYPRSKIPVGVDITFNPNVEYHIDYVHSVVVKYVRPNTPRYDELFSAGVEGLVRAASKYNPTRGIPFIGYANWWIKKKIFNEMCYHNGLAGKTAIREKVGRKKREINQKLQQGLTLEEISAQLEVSQEELEEGIQAHQPVVSLDTPLHDNDQRTMANLLISDSPCDHHSTPLSDHPSLYAPKIIERFEREGILTERESQVLRLRYCSGAPKLVHHEEVGKVIGMAERGEPFPKQRIKQIEDKAIIKARKAVRRIWGC